MYILIFSIAILLLASLIIRNYQKNWSKHIDVSFKFVGEAVTEGEKGEIVQTVVNKKLLPLWWGDLQFLVSNFLKFDYGEDIDHEYYKKDAVSAIFYEMVKKH